MQDSGKYMVKAENSGGEAQSIADFLVLESQPDRMVEITKTVVFSDLPQDQVKVSLSILPSTLNFSSRFLSIQIHFSLDNNYETLISPIRA